MRRALENQARLLMPQSLTLDAQRGLIRDHYLADEEARAKHLIEIAELSSETRTRAQAKAADFVRAARAHATRSGLIDKFLQEYGLSTAEGVTLDAARRGAVAHPRRRHRQCAY